MGLKQELQQQPAAAVFSKVFSKQESSAQQGLLEVNPTFPPAFVEDFVKDLGAEQVLEHVAHFRERLADTGRKPIRDLTAYMIRALRHPHEFGFRRDGALWLRPRIVAANNPAEAEKRREQRRIEEMLHRRRNEPFKGFAQKE